MIHTMNIAFDESHKELIEVGKKGEHEWECWSKIEELLKTQGYNIIILKDSLIKDADLSKIDVLILGAPQTEFTEEEITTVINFVKKGGSLFALNEYGGDLQNGTNISNITKHFGIEFNNDLIHDKIHNIKGHDYGPIISDFEVVSAMTFNIREFNIMLGCSLNVTQEAQVIARSSKDAYVKKITSEKKWEESEMPSMPVLAAYYDFTRKGIKGRVVAIGDTHIFSDDDLGLPLHSNKVLFNNILEWLIEPSLNVDEKLFLISTRINEIADGLVILKKKMGIVEVDTTVSKKGTYLPEEVVARIDKLENLLERVEKLKGEEDIRYYKQRIRLATWANVISIVSVVTVILINTLINILIAR